MMKWSFATYQLDDQRFELKRSDVVVPLQRRAFDVLLYLLANCDRVVSRSELLVAVWGRVAVTDASVAHAVMGARKALGDEGQSVLQTIRQRGYRICVPVRQHADEPGRCEPVQRVGSAPSVLSGG
jgi:DNA-binding winged helix-turn-helix (wHTH) protein